MNIIYLLRSVGAVLAGLAAIIVLSIATDFVLENSVFPELAKPTAPAHLWLLAAAYRSVYSVAGSYIAAWLAPDRRMTHALVLGLVGFVISIVGAVFIVPDGVPHWFTTSLIILALPCAWLGGKLYEIRYEGVTT